MPNSDLLPFLVPTPEPTPPDITQDIALPAARYLVQNSNRNKLWLFSSARPQINSDFVPDGVSRYVGIFQLERLSNARNIMIRLDDTASGGGFSDQDDFASDFETMGTLTLTLSTGEVLELDMSDYSDNTDPYQFAITDPATQTAFDTLFAALSTTAASEAGTLTLTLPGSTPPEPTTHSHTVTITSVGTPFAQASWRGWKQADSRSGEQGTATNLTFKTPDGVSRQIQFIIAMNNTGGRIELTDLTPEAQFPDRITFTRGSQSQVWGNRTGYADRFGAQADYSRVSGDANVLAILASGTSVDVLLEWD